MVTQKTQQETLETYLQQVKQDHWSLKSISKFDIYDFGIVHPFHWFNSSSKDTPDEDVFYEEGKSLHTITKTALPP